MSDICDRRIVSGIRIRVEEVNCNLILGFNIYLVNLLGVSAKTAAPAIKDLSCSSKFLLVVSS